MLLLPNEIQSLILQFCNPRALMLFSLTSLSNHLRLNATLPKIPTKVKCGDLSEEYTLSEKGLISPISYKYTSALLFDNSYPRGNKDQIKYMRSGRLLLPGHSSLMYIYTKGKKITNFCPANYIRERWEVHNPSRCSSCQKIRQLQGNNLIYNRHQNIAEFWIQRGYINGITVSGDGSLLKYTNIDWRRKIRLDVIVKYLNKKVANLNIIIHQKIEVLEYYLTQGKEYVLGYSWEFSYHSARPKVLKWLFTKGLIEKRHLLCSISRLYNSSVQNSYQYTGIFPFIAEDKPVYDNKINNPSFNSKSDNRENRCHSCFCKPFMPSSYPILNPLPFYKWLFTSNIGVGNTGANITFEDINSMSSNGCFQKINSFELLPPNLLEWSCGIHKINDVYCEDKTNPVNYRMHPIDDGILSTISTGILAARPTKHSINHAICYDDMFRLKIALHFITPSEEDLENASRNNKIEAMKLLLHFNNSDKCISDAAMKHCYYWAPEGIKEIMLPYI